ncbi:hypothetical protein E5676_scaffold263G00140 [Cucumis melo var. makuwa]|uniref:Uncharacterized protein n=1 Tax=Cucumis melo var. makuwa TaxID=1194695 RepID=A0A5D3CI31_CUCMM|nr:hypothetical protein E5676_scaffold263G00140 [Cucumis melo var. makuwa]
MVKTSMQSSKKVGTDQDLKDFKPQSDNSMLSRRSLPLDNPFTPLVEEPKDFPIDCNDFPFVDNEVDNQLVCVEEDGSTLENKTEEDVLVNGTDIEPFVTTQKSFPLNKKVGLKARPKRALIKDLIVKFNRNVVIFHETKSSDINRRFIKYVWRNRRTGWVALDAIRMSAGILIMWKEDSITMIDAMQDGFLRRLRAGASLKVLTKKLEKVLPSTIHDAQKALVNGSQILDAILTTSESLEEWKMKGKRGTLLKVDLEKAYDKVDWTFLDAILKLKA